jgi:hypothetical protein
MEMGTMGATVTATSFPSLVEHRSCPERVAVILISGFKAGDKTDSNVSAEGRTITVGHRKTRRKQQKTRVETESKKGGRMCGSVQKKTRKQLGEE